MDFVPQINLRDRKKQANSLFSQLVKHTLKFRHIFHVYKARNLGCLIKNSVVPSLKTGNW